MSSLEFGYEFDNNKTIKNSTVEPKILGEFLTGNFSNAIDTRLGQNEIARILLENPDSNIDLKAKIITRLPLEREIREIILSEIRHPKIINNIKQRPQGELLKNIVNELFSEETNLQKKEIFINTYKETIETAIIYTLIQESKDEIFSILEKIYSQEEVNIISLFLRQHLKNHIALYKDISMTTYILQFSNNLSESELTTFNNIVNDHKESIHRKESTEYFKSTSKEDFFHHLADIFSQNSGSNNATLDKYAKYTPYKTSETYTYIKTNYNELLDNLNFKIYMTKLYNPQKSIIGSTTVASDEIEKYLLSIIDLFNDEKINQILKNLIVLHGKGNNEFKIRLFTLYCKIFTRVSAEINEEIYNFLFLDTTSDEWLSCIDILEEQEKISIWILLLKQLTKASTKDGNKYKTILERLDTNLIQNIYGALEPLDKPSIIHLLKQVHPLAFLSEDEKNKSGINSFLVSNGDFNDLQKYIDYEGLSLCSTNELLEIISSPEILSKEECQHYLIYNSHKDSQNIFNKTLSKENKIALVKTHPTSSGFLFRIFDDITFEEKLQIYCDLPKDIDKMTIQKVFSSIYFSEEHGLEFAKYYPLKGFTDPRIIQRDHSVHYDVTYSTVCRKLLKKYTLDENKSAITSAVLEKLQDKVLIDLGCGHYRYNIGALAYQSDAALYVGIDVNTNGEMYDNRAHEYIIKQYNLDPNSIKKTTFKTIFDNFEKFLEKAPTNAGYNFAINGLILTSSSDSIRTHINRLMRPGNVIIANNTENLKIGRLLDCPYKHTRIGGLFGGDGMHVYEKLADEKIILT